LRRGARCSVAAPTAGRRRGDALERVRRAPGRRRGLVEAGRETFSTAGRVVQRGKIICDLRVDARASTDEIAHTLVEAASQLLCKLDGARLVELLKQALDEAPAGLERIGAGFDRLDRTDDALPNIVRRCAQRREDPVARRQRIVHALFGLQAVQNGVVLIERHLPDLAVEFERLAQGLRLEVVAVGDQA
jgi:hypothetical protein